MRNEGKKVGKVKGRERMSKTFSSPFFDLAPLADSDLILSVRRGGEEIASEHIC